jgi:hypothetical protein
MRFAALAAFVSLPAIGCSAAVADEPDQAPVGDSPSAVESGVTEGSVTVERTVTLASSAAGQAVRTHVSARFMRVRGGIDHDAAEQMVASPFRLPADAPLGCSWMTVEPGPMGQAEGTVELLDVGDIVLHVDSTATQLAARAFPDVGDIVSGVVYTSRDHSADLPLGGSYLIETTGSDVMERFSMRVDAPRAPAAVRLGEQPVESDDLEVATDHPLTVSWEPIDAAPSDRIYLDVLPLEADGGAALRCVFEDDGRGVVPARFVRWDPGVELEVAVHRYRRTELGAADMTSGEELADVGVDGAVVDFDFALTARATARR